LNTPLEKAQVKIGNLWDFFSPQNQKAIIVPNRIGKNAKNGEDFAKK
jgi:hypothetical protein